MRGCLNEFRSKSITRGEIPLTRLAATRRATLSRKGRGKTTYFGSNAFNLSMSRTFILKPPGMTMSPGF